MPRYCRSRPLPTYNVYINNNKNDFAKPVAVTYATEVSRNLRAQELCESRCGRPGLPVPKKKPTVSVDVKQRFNQPSRYQVTELPSVCRSQCAVKKKKRRRRRRRKGPFKARELRWRSKTPTLKTKEQRSLAVDMKTVQHVPRRFWIHASSGVRCKAGRRAKRERREF